MVEIAYLAFDSTKRYAMKIVFSPSNDVSRMHPDHIRPPRHDDGFDDTEHRMVCHGIHRRFPPSSSVLSESAAMEMWDWVLGNLLSPFILDHCPPFGQLIAPNSLPHIRTLTDDTCHRATTDGAPWFLCSWVAGKDHVESWS
jgi:hypothetical protein